MNSSLRKRMAQSRLPRTNAPRWSSAYLNLFKPASMIPVKLRRVTKVKNFRYVLNQRLNKIHRLILGFGGGTFLIMTSVTFSLLLCELAAGRDNESSGTLERGVIPSCTGETGESCELKLEDPFGLKYTKGNGSISWFMPFSASSTERSLGVRPPIT